MNNFTDVIRLTWTNHPSVLTASLVNYLASAKLVDVELKAGGKNLFAHKLVLSVSCEFFDELFKIQHLAELNKMQIVEFHDISFDILELLMTYIYTGEVQIPNKKMISFTEAANKLKLSGWNQNIKLEKPACIKEVSKENDMKCPKCKSNVLKEELLNHYKIAHAESISINKNLLKKPATDRYRL